MAYSILSVEKKDNRFTVRLAWEEKGHTPNEMLKALGLSHEALYGFSTFTLEDQTFDENSGEWTVQFMLS